MRKTSLDEFPQFLNVLIGDMSFIGPRPKVGQIDYNNLTEDKRKSYSIKPGVTGYSQAFFRNSISNEEKYHYDAFYADHISFMMDVKIIFKTIQSVLFRKNINTEQTCKK
jgi:lipopolysaccharide/colanic/teichoic acid biosynthesis glycosyltransferase